MVNGLGAQVRRLTGDVANATIAAATAERMSESAQRAYAQGNMDQRTLADFETTALDRRIAALALERSLGESQITLTVELGLGLPRARIAPVLHPRKS